MTPAATPTWRPIWAGSIYRVSTPKPRRQRPPPSGRSSTRRDPPKTPSWRTLDELGNPEVITLLQLCNCTPAAFGDYLRDRKNSRVIPHRLEECGYVRVRNAAAEDGQWKVGGKRQAIYGRADLPLCERYAAAAAMVAGR